MLSCTSTAGPPLTDAAPVKTASRQITEVEDDFARRRFVAGRSRDDSLPIAPNLLARNFNPEAPDRVWSGDITYIATDEGWLYPAAVIDLFSRQVVGWSMQPHMQPHMQTSLVTDALRMAWFRRHPAPGLIFHSDRGSQYCSASFQAALASYGMKSSMSRKGNCWESDRRSDTPLRASGAA